MVLVVHILLVDLLSLFVVTAVALLIQVLLAWGAVTVIAVTPWQSLDFFNGSIDFTAYVLDISADLGLFIYLLCHRFLYISYELHWVPHLSLRRHEALPQFLDRALLHVSNQLGALSLLRSVSIFEEIYILREILTTLTQDI